MSAAKSNTKAKPKTDGTPKRGYLSERKHHAFLLGIEGKDCSSCKTWHPLDAYGIAKRRWDGRREVCKSCRASKTIEQSETRKPYYRQYNALNKEQRLQASRKCKAMHRDEVLQKRRTYYEQNRQKELEASKIYQRERRRTNPWFRLHTNMATTVWLALKSKKQGRRWQSLVGYS